MRLALLFLLVSFFAAVLAKTNTHKALTESLGQEVIEINAPVKELDEEPAAENEDDEPTTVTTIQPATRNRKPTALETRRRPKDEKAGSGKLDDEEARIAKELAEIYKDNADYKEDKSEESTTTEAATVASSEVPSTKEAPRSGKEAERQRSDSFKFQPNDINDKQEVERFRTSVDDISCDKSQSKLADEEMRGVPKSAYTALGSLCLIAVVELFALVCA